MKPVVIEERGAAIVEAQTLNAKWFLGRSPMGAGSAGRADAECATHRGGRKASCGKPNDRIGFGQTMICRVSNQ